MALMQDGSIANLTGAVSQSNAPKTIRLMDMIDTLIQKSYHDLVVLAEVELRSTTISDMDKKVAIMKYLSRTRNYFIRFLALLEWSSSMSKVEKCFHIVDYLEDQAGVFVETADVLVRMARETLANSKLPCYQVSFAVDVLNSRTCPRMPSCIKEKIVPMEPLTQQEKEDTLRELEYVLLNRLVTSDRPPQEMRNFVIRRGRVVFTVKDEFEVALTVMGEDKSMPFRILALKFLVKNRRVGEGRPLVHAQQVAYLIQLLQSRIMDNDKPLVEVYQFLHTFSQSLQMEVLYTQLTRHMTGGRLDYFRTEKYVPGREIKVSYWEEISTKTLSAPRGYTIALAAADQGITIAHQPLVDADTTLRELDVGTVMMSVIHFRVKTRLSKLQNELSRHFACSTTGFPLLLLVPLYPSSPRSHCVQISVDYYTGRFTVQLERLPQKSVQALRDTLNTFTYKYDKLVELLRNLKLELILELIKSLAGRMHLQAPTHLALFGGEPFERLNKLGPYKAIFRFQKKLDVTALLVASVHEDSSVADGARVDYHAILVEQSGLKGMKVLALVDREKLSESAHYLLRETLNTPAETSAKNPLELLKTRLQTMREHRAESRVQMSSTKILPAALVDFERTVNSLLTETMFSELQSVLKTREISAGPVTEVVYGGESPGTPILSLPVRLEHDLNLLRSCAFRRVGKLATTTNASFYVDFVLSGVPFQKNSSTLSCTFAYDSTFSSEKIVEWLSYDWQSMTGLLRLMRRFKAFLDTKAHPPGVRYDVSYNLRKVRILYGPNLELAMLLSWDRNEKKSVLEFYGQTDGVWNPHRTLKDRLLGMIRPKTGSHVVDLSHIFDVLMHTAPLVLGVRESYRPVGVVRIPRSLTPQLTFQFVPISLSQYVIIWKGSCCLWIKILNGPKFLVRDVGNSHTGSKRNDERVFQPIAGLRAIIEAALSGKPTGFSDVAGVDQELQHLIYKLFTYLRGYPVRLAAGSN